jgi:Fe-S oxidoreductase
MIDEFLLRPGLDGVPRYQRAIAGRKGSVMPLTKIMLHGHCYQKARPPHADGLPTGTEASTILLRACGYEVEVIDSGCCGMAGAFGYEAEHFELSQKVAELGLFPVIRNASFSQKQDIIVSAAGISCQAQIEDGLQQAAIHPIVLFAQGIEGTRDAHYRGRHMSLSGTS